MNITYGAVVKEIRKVSNSTKIIYEKNGIQTEHNADYCICTIPTTVLKDIPNDFSEAHKTEITLLLLKCSQTRISVTSVLGTRSQYFWRYFMDESDITQIWYPSNALGHLEE